ncbi:Hypothetical Protein FCC1311_074112 [Hondaea fermentalgiana]|uniref:Uncharacterized protein n=1 Tax=Hondaea fermentalgiana TaxID=2315210 RepID=A0A2R5GJY2_9STRA|nr:Hypothetical Protein FCC1311_074112 [Hondaea fermentalgiana]|eukprot:GBG31190.1 Hypothetical Protein FCC1311_074112 [Hondaea fermentalgiana]
MGRTVELPDSLCEKVTRSAEDRGQKISQLSQEPRLQQQQQHQQQQPQMHPQMLVAQGLWNSHQQQFASQMQDGQPGQMQNSQQVLFAGPMPGMTALNGQATHAIGNWFPGGIMMHPGFLSQPTKSNACINESNESLALGMYLSQVQQQPQQQQQQLQSMSLNQAQKQLLQASAHMAQGKSLADMPRFIPAPQPPLELLSNERAPSMHVRHNTPLPPRWLNVEVLVAFSVDYSKSTPDSFVFTSDIIEKGFLFHFMKRTKFHSLTPKQYRAAVRKLVSDCRPGYSNEDRESLPKELLARLRDHVEFVGRSHWGFKRFVVIGPDCAKFRDEQQIVERNAANFSPVVRSMLESSRESDAQTFGGSFLSAPREKQQFTSSTAPFAQTAAPNFWGQQRMISTPSVSLELSETKKRKDFSRNEHTENEGGNERFAAQKLRKIECSGPTP